MAEEGYATTPVLTLDQVRQAGRLAWHPKHHYLYSDGRLLRVVLFSPLRSSPPAPITLTLRPSALHGDEQHVQSGWRHLEGCDCPLCTNPRTVGDRKSNGRSSHDSG
jgi:hypothetical protein